MLNKLYKKSEIWFAVLWIVAYCVLFSLGDAASELLGVEKSVTLPVGLLLSLGLFAFLKQGDLLSTYGICRPMSSARSMLYYIPLIVMLSANLWFGVALNYSILETILYILSMFCVGFLEEVIFRGLLFGAMRKDSFKAAVIVSSLTFGIGHIINLVNGSGADLLSSILQIIYATAAGFMFVMIYYRSGSLIIPILAHGLFNSLSAFSSALANTPTAMIISAVILTLITGSYAAYLAVGLKPEEASECADKGDADQL
ncbi:MAG: CPBP family intramembrane metalloprotease [Clostridia bacterium]|nr:CPBP family intramembrane metalloprotease [Clostridia bacterium]